MRRLLLAATLIITPVIAAAGQPSAEELAAELAKLKQQVAQLANRNPKAGLRVGYVNIVRVFDELEQKIDMNTTLRQLEETRDKQLRGLATRIKDLTESTKLLRPDSAEYKKNTQQIEQAKSEFRSRRNATEDHLYNKLFDFTHSIYKKIRAEVQGYAREAGYDLVLRVRDPEIGTFDQALRPRTRYVELNRRIEYRSVVFHRSAHDFTDAIIKRLNEKFLREKAEKKREQPPAATAKPNTNN